MFQKAVRVSLFQILILKQISQVILLRVFYLLKQICQAEETIQTGLHPTLHLVGTLTMPGNLWLPGRNTLTVLTLTALTLTILTLTTQYYSYSYYSYYSYSYCSYYSYSYRQDDSYYGADSYVSSAAVSLSQE